MNRNLVLFCFRVYHKKYTFPKFEKSRFEIDDFTSLQSRTILPSKWSGEWAEFNLKLPSRDITLVPWVYLHCYSFLLASERIRKKTCPSDSESSFVGLVYQQRNTALAASFLSCPQYCENDCGTKVTSEVVTTWYFGRAIQIPFVRVKMQEFEGF